MSISKIIKKGQKRICENCSTKFYDFLKNPIICPVCKNEHKPENINDQFHSSNQTVYNNKENKLNKEVDDLSDQENIEENNDDEVISLEEVEDEKN